MKVHKEKKKIILNSIEYNRDKRAWKIEGECRYELHVKHTFKFIKSETIACSMMNYS